MCQDCRCQSIFRPRLKLVTLADFFLFPLKTHTAKIISNYKQKIIKTNLQQRASFPSSAFMFGVKEIFTNNACVSHPFLLYDFVYVLYLWVLFSFAFSFVVL